MSQINFEKFSDIRMLDTQHSFETWLFKHALPLWRDKGEDHTCGGFYERLHLDGAPHNIDRRTRVAARQVYSYATARKMGYSGEVEGSIAHGFAWLTGPARNKATDLVYAVLGPDGTIVRQHFDLYDHAFVMLACAAVYAVRPDEHLKVSAAMMRDNIIRRYSHPKVGFRDTDIDGAPLKANPHMHLLEACLAWIEIGGDEVWEQLASDIIDLCLDRFIDPETGALKEFFDRDWSPLKSDAGRIVEPGHQFEWAWLLLRWSGYSFNQRCYPVAERLIEVAEKYGTDPVRNVTVNEIWDDFSPKDLEARLWPQTERVKAYSALLKSTTNERLRRDAQNKILEASQGLKQYLTGGIRGLYRDRMLVDGTFVEESAPASTLYHIVCAIQELCSLRDTGYPG